MGRELGRSERRRRERKGRENIWELSTLTSADEREREEEGGRGMTITDREREKGGMTGRHGGDGEIARVKVGKERMKSGQQMEQEFKKGYMETERERKREINIFSVL